MNMFNIIISGAVVLLTVAIIILAVKQSTYEEELDEEAATDADTRLICLEHKTEKLTDDIEKTLKRLEEIADDIGRLDQLSKKDHSDLVDIRERYILWRKPVDKGAGVTWAKDYPCLDEGDDNA